MKYLPVDELNIIDATGVDFPEIAKDLARRIGKIKKGTAGLFIEGTIELKYTGVSVLEWDKALLMCPETNGKFSLEISKNLRLLILLY